MDATGTMQRGYFLLADLSGYTAYLAGSEPTHGPLIAADFIETMVGRLRGAFALQKLEGDAAFLFAPADRVSGTQLLDAVDAAYFAFQRRVRSVSQATACECEACQRIPQLDLKFVCHVGDALQQRIAGRDELAGRDVIVAHRLLKGTSTERAGAHSYLLALGRGDDGARPRACRPGDGQPHGALRRARTDQLPPPGPRQTLGTRAAVGRGPAAERETPRAGSSVCCRPLRPSHGTC